MGLIDLLDQRALPLRKEVQDAADGGYVKKMRKHVLKGMATK